MSARQKPLHQEIAKFVEFHLGKGCFAPMTGQDFPAWRAFVYLIECHAHGGGSRTIQALRATVRCAQQNERVLRCFVQAIPGVMDWGDVRRLWPQIAHDLTVELDDGEPASALVLGAYERSSIDPTRVTIWRPLDVPEEKPPYTCKCGLVIVHREDALAHLKTCPRGAIRGLFA